jgi:hypothetical protein
MNLILDERGSGDVAGVLHPRRVRHGMLRPREFLLAAGWLQIYVARCSVNIKISGLISRFSCKVNPKLEDSTLGILPNCHHSLLT